MKTRDDSTPRALLIAEQANPEWVSVPLEGWSHARAIQRVCDAHVVTQVRNEPAFRRAGATDHEFTAIDSERVAARLDRLGERLRGGSGKGWTLKTALSGVHYRYFERLVWDRFEHRIRAGEFDLVHRLTPLSPTTPSPMGAWCARAGVPFILGPLNGGVPWPRGFDHARRREREWLSYVRSAHKLAPGYRATRRHASAIICGSLDTLGQMPAWARDRCVYIPENAVDPERFAEAPSERSYALPLRLAFVGRLVPYKGADMLLEAAAPLVRDGLVTIEIIGEGPERGRLESLIERERLGGGVTLAGWVEHTRLQERLARAHVFAFPSVREFGGAVVLEAMAMGAVPVILDYAGPAELVTPQTGIKLPIGSRAQIVANLRTTLERLAEDRSGLPGMSFRGRRRVLDHFTWDAKAARVLRVYDWALGRSERPEFAAPCPDDEAPASPTEKASVVHA